MGRHALEMVVPGGKTDGHKDERLVLDHRGEGRQLSEVEPPIDKLDDWCNTTSCADRIG